MTSNQQNYKQLFQSDGKKVAVLVDPDKHDEKSLTNLLVKSDKAGVDFFMIGGSLLLNPINESIDLIKSCTSTPLVLFPGNLLQLSSRVDAILLLSLISGRNPDLLIGNHVLAAPVIKKSGVETISTGYILIGTGKQTSVEYMSNTTAIPGDKADIVVATAIAGEMLGLKLIYLDSGSGALNPVSSRTIRMVKSNTSIPLVVGGGLRNVEDVKNACSAGANVIVIGNVLEQDSDLIFRFCEQVHQF